MIARIVTLITLVLLLTSKPLQAGDTCVTINTAFKTGEQLKYHVGYKWYALKFNAGVINFKVDPALIKNKQAYHYSAVGKTYKSYDWFFRVRDKYDSWVDKETLMPIKFIRDVDENGYYIYETINFQQNNNLAYVKKDNDKKFHKYKVPACTQDVLSIIYWSRGLDFTNYKKNDTVPVKVFIDKEMFSLYIRYLGKETIKTKFGKVRCVVFAPLLIEGTLFSGGEKMKIWATDDANHLPVLVETPIVVGKIRAQLVSYSGLKYPFSSKVK